MTNTAATSYADEIMKMIDDDIADGLVPANVASFVDLYDHVDANEYTLHADVPHDLLAEGGMDLVHAVENEVTRRLAARFAARCTNPTHDHVTTVDANGEPVDQSRPMTCSDCEQPSHYDTTTDTYQHDDPNAAACFLSGPNTVNPCTPAVTS